MSRNGEQSENLISKHVSHAILSILRRVHLKDNNNYAAIRSCPIPALASKILKERSMGSQED